MMHTPQEIAVWYILPALRRELAIALKEQELTQTKIAEILQITKPAVSQYLSKKRASEISFDRKVKDKVRQAAKNILKTGNAMGELQKLLKYIEKEKIICKIHQQYSTCPNKCNACYQ